MMADRDRSPSLVGMPDLNCVSGADTFETPGQRGSGTGSALKLSNPARKG
jgi:hypothetical protein